MYNLTNKNIQIISSLENICKTHYSGGQTRYVSSIVINNKIISLGFNNYKTTNRLQLKFKIDNKHLYKHAEVDAILKALKILTKENISKSTIYIIRLSYNKSSKEYLPFISKPCNSCIKAIQYFNIKNIIYFDKEYIKVRNIF